MNRNAASKHMKENNLNNRTSMNGNNNDMRSHHTSSGYTITEMIFVHRKSICSKKVLDLNRPIALVQKTTECQQ